MGLPAPKVANMPGVVNQRWPAGFLGHNRVVNPDRKEDGRALLAFPRQGGFDFLLHPLARHRRLGQDEEQLVIEADRLINPGAEAIADFHSFRGKPALYPFTPEIRVEVFGEGVIFTRIADETGVELEGLIEERW